MVKVYAIVLAAGILGLLVFILGGALADNVGRQDRDPGVRFGVRAKVIIGAAIGFGMGGMSAEFSPLDLTWQVSLLIALVAAALSVIWVRYAVGPSRVR
jgi:MFS family permease